MRDFHAICDFGGRFAGSDGEAAACDWLEARLERVSGVAPSRFPVHYAGWSRGEAVVERIDGAGGTHACVSLVRSPATPPDGLEADLVDVGRGTEADFDAAGAAVAGNVVLVRHEYMFAADTVHRRRKYGWAVERGAAGFLIASHIPGPDHPVTGSSGATPRRGIPAAGISAATAAALTRGGGARVRLRITVDEAPRRADNLILDLPGKGSGRVVLSAHLDGHHLADERPWTMPPGSPRRLAVAAELAPRARAIRKRAGGSSCSISRSGRCRARLPTSKGCPRRSERRFASTSISTPSPASPDLTALTSGFPALETWLVERAGGARCQARRASAAHGEFRPLQLRPCRSAGGTTGRRIRRARLQPALRADPGRHSRQDPCRRSRRRGTSVRRTRRGRLPRAGFEIAVKERHADTRPARDFAGWSVSRGTCEPARIRIK